MIRQTFYIGFGFDHPLGKYVLKVEATTENEAREMAGICFPMWASINRSKPNDDRIVIESKVTADVAIKTYRVG